MTATKPTTDAQGHKYKSSHICGEFLTSTSLKTHALMQMQMKQLENRSPLSHLRWFLGCTAGNRDAGSCTYCYRSKLTLHSIGITALST